MKKIIIIFIILCLSSLSFSFEKGVYEYKTHWIYSGESVKLSWDPVNNATEYEVIAQHLETEQEIAMGKTSNTSISIVVQRVGHYIFKVRAVNDCGKSGWATTIDSYPVDGKPSWVYAQLAPATGLGIQ